MCLCFYTIITIFHFSRFCQLKLHPCEKQLSHRSFIINARSDRQSQQRLWERWKTAMFIAAERCAGGWKGLQGFPCGCAWLRTYSGYPPFPWPASLVPDMFPSIHIITLLIQVLHSCHNVPCFRYLSFWMIIHNSESLNGFLDDHLCLQEEIWKSFCMGPLFSGFHVEKTWSWMKHGEKNGGIADSTAKIRPKLSL